MIVIGQREQNRCGAEILAVVIGVLLENGNSYLRRSVFVLEGKRLHTKMLRVKFRDLLHIVQRWILGFSVAPYRCKYDAVEIKCFALLVSRLVAARNRKTENKCIA